MKMKISLTVLAVLIGWVFFTECCFANLKITPVTVKLSNDNPRAKVNLLNTGDTPIILKCGVAQKVTNGKQVTFVPKRDVVLAVPKVINIKSKQEKAVRLALHKKVAKAEIYYLTLLSEAKKRGVKLENTNHEVRPNLSIKIEHDIPVFVTPKS